MERTLEWDGEAIITVDQSALPGEYRKIRLTTVSELTDAINRLAIRGAPALGAAGALGVVLSTHLHSSGGVVADFSAVHADAELIIGTRPTAVNLEWGVRRVLNRLSDGPIAVLTEAMSILDQDERVNIKAARRAARYLLHVCAPRPLRVLTHCHTGRLATVAGGTALGAIRELSNWGQLGEVLVGETRPLLQGSRLTAWELSEARIQHRVCPDSAGPAAIACGMVDCVLVGADRIAANGDVANKIGTYSLALAADRAAIPFLVVAPESSRDESLATGAEIAIEERPAHEVTYFNGQAIAPTGTAAYNPAFDVTPTALVTAIITERQVIQTADCRPRML